MKHFLFIGFRIIVLVLVSILSTAVVTAQTIIASDNFDTPLNLSSISNTTDLGTVSDHEDQFTTPGDLFGITDGNSDSPMPRQAPFAISDDAADMSCDGFFPNDNQGVLPCNYGNNYFGVVDTENGENMGLVSSEWVFDITSATSLSQICIDMGAMGDFESSDMQTWTVAIDGGAATTIFELEADLAASATYSITNSQTLNDPMTVNGVQVLNGLTTFCADLSALGTGSTLTLSLSLISNGGGEAVAYDNIVIEGEASVIPTMGQWALFILALMMSSLGLVFMFNHKRTLA